ncbi:MAG: EAL domain-containing protein [Acidobacteria bacterium]|nr:MAG: EAL domain-containing protein [Acidobacteriota bacterium]REK01827.1 MAG: EAL domain-containing protein [Acidobacteriota bacterium]REK14783.1 MAG: EAL domain-containing protein [Acidobacteriota bacterium]REK45498.1 MAG: EAL domain-containing protein [Acidobacteriota bacterium]
MKDRLKNRLDIAYIGAFAFSLAALGASVYSFPVASVDGRLFVIVSATLIFSTFAQIQLPRVKVHITVSDILVFLAIILYGLEIATLLAFAESITASASFKKRGINITTRTILLNGAIAAISTYATVKAAELIIGAPEVLTSAGDASGLAVTLAFLALTLFLTNSVLVTLFTSLKTGRSLWEVWYLNCLNGLILYLTAAFFAGLIATAIYSFNSLLVGIGLATAGLIYFTFWRYVTDVKKTSAKAEQVERERAEQAERHVEELEHHVAQKDKAEVALRKSREKFRHAAFHDSLTGLPNRNYFRKRIGELLASRRSGTGKHFAVLFLDLNRFKRINDSFGHSFGDQYLKRIANRLETLECGRKVVSRLGGDEFGVILERPESYEAAESFASSIAEAIARPVEIDEKQIYTGVSIGIVICEGGYDSAEEVIRDSDIAMYHAKESKKPFVVFDKAMHEYAVKQLEIETDVRQAIENNELMLNYQPIVDLETLAISGLEALVRWNHPVRGFVSPVEFVPVCESTGLIVPLTRWILKEACQRTADWTQEYLPDSPLFISVNLSGRHFADPDILEHIKEVLDSTGIAASQLKLEITESAVMDNAETAIEALMRIRGMGVRVSIDDFGTGYSSLSYLHRFPVSTLKIDRSFVSGIGSETGNGKLVATIVAMAKTLDLDVIAEGIETADQMDHLRALGCEFGQGYLFSKPLALSEVAELLNTGFTVGSHGNPGLADRWPNPQRPAVS